MRSPSSSGWNRRPWKSRRVLLIAQIITLLTNVAPLYAQTGGGLAHVHAVRFVHLPDRTRLVMDTDRDLPFRLVSGSVSEQLEVTLDGIDNDALASALDQKIPRDHELIRGYRLDGEDPASTRMIVQFRQPVTCNLFNLKPDLDHGYRLVLDFFEVPLSQQQQGEPASLVGASHGRSGSETVPRGGEVESQVDANEKQDPATATDYQTADKPSVRTLPQTPAKTTRFEEFWLGTRINNQNPPTTVLALRQADGQLLLTGSDLRRLRIIVPPGGGIGHLGEQFYSLEDLNIEAKLDLRRMTLDLQAPAALFGTTSLKETRRQQLPLTPSPFGAFFNYDLTSTQTYNNDVQSSALLELGAFNGWGSGISSFLTRDNQPETEPSFVRLDTTWRRDNPQEMRTLVLGDSITRGTNWSGAVRIGGMQWSSNFTLQPGFITMPLMSMAGEATLPSTVDLYVNDALRLRREVPPGPFVIDDIPTITGRGETRLVVTDILGRERIITQDFYASQRMLRSGLDEYSVELGAVRNDYGRKSNEYTNALASATWRTGVSDRLTAEFHAQATSNHQMAGVGASWLMPFGGVAYSALATSQSGNRHGELFNLGLQHQGEVFSVGFDSQFATEDFIRLGMDKGQPLPGHQSRFFGNVANSSGSWGVGYTFQNYRQRQDVEFATLSYSLGLGRFGYMSLSALHFIDDDSTTLQASFTLPLGMKHTTASFGLSHSEDRTEGKIQVQRSLPAGTGFGYRLELGVGDSDLQKGSVSYQNDYGSLQLEGSRMRGRTGARANLRGGLAFLDGGFYPSRRIDDSFAVVKVPGFADVRIYAENQEVARTNADGEALVPRLRAYEKNHLRVEQADIPLGANIGNLEMQVAPYHRSGVALEFPVNRTRDVFFSLILDDGNFLPVGATVSTESGEYYPVGMRGEVFLTKLKPVNKLEAHLGKQTCHFVVEVPESDEPLIELGEIRCSGISLE